MLPFCICFSLVRESHLLASVLRGGWCYGPIWPAVLVCLCSLSLSLCNRWIGPDWQGDKRSALHPGSLWWHLAFFPVLGFTDTPKHWPVLRFCFLPLYWRSLHSLINSRINCNLPCGEPSVCIRWFAGVFAGHIFNTFLSFTLGQDVESNKVYKVSVFSFIYWFFVLNLSSAFNLSNKSCIVLYVN